MACPEFISNTCFTKLILCFCLSTDPKELGFIAITDGSSTILIPEPDNAAVLALIPNCRKS